MQSRDIPRTKTTPPIAYIYIQSNLIKMKRRRTTVHMVSGIPQHIEACKRLGRNSTTKTTSGMLASKTARLEPLRRPEDQASQGPLANSVQSGIDTTESRIDH